MDYIESNLVPGETVVYKTRLHWIVMLGHIIWGSLLLLLPGIVLLYEGFTQTEAEHSDARILEVAGVLLLLAGVVVILLGNVRRNATEMGVTNRRVLVKTGLIDRKMIEMLLGKVESIEISETALGRMLGYGSIVVVGTGGTSEPFHKIEHPLAFRNQVQQQIEKLQ